MFFAVHCDFMCRGEPMCSPEDVVLLNRFSKETKVVLSGRTHGCAPTVSRKYCAINSNNHIAANTFSDAALV